MRRHAVLALAVAAALLAGCSASPTPDPTDPETVEPSSAVEPTESAAEPETVAPGEEWIAFEDADGYISLIRTDGSGLHSLTDSVIGDAFYTPEWDPTGSRIAFTAETEESEDLWIVGADGSGPELLVPCALPCMWVMDPAWSPDGSTIAYGRMVEQGETSVDTLELVDVATGTTTVLLGPWEDRSVGSPRWSPDGTQLALELVHYDEEDDAVGVELVTLTVDDPTQLTTVVGGDLWVETPAWSPDGSRLAFGALASPDAETTDLYSVAPDGSGLTQLTTVAEGGGWASNPSFRPDGASLIFSGQTSEESDVMLGELQLADGAIDSATGETIVEGYRPRLRPVA